ncbi:hypothetical protein PLIIFM63780_009758 [Purpureocillium lilacinum]|nr:hypothetical protein PLIIFM63780_009758 [Purpureocillium lilacinum]
MGTASGSDGTGFPRLASRMAMSPDYETFIFRRYDRLSARNLLHLESRLAYLDWKLSQADQEAALSQDNETLRSVRVWEAFEDHARDPSRPECARMKIAEQVREALQEYREDPTAFSSEEALLRQNQIAILEEPKQRALNVARCQAYQSEDNEPGRGKRRRPVLGGLAASRLDESNRRDLIAVRRLADKDLLSRFLQDHWMFQTTRLTDETEYVDERHVAWVAAAVSTVVATVLLLGAIFLLRLLENETSQLGVIAMFTVLFAASVGVLTNARRAEIFAATAAYSALV